MEGKGRIVTASYSGKFTPSAGECGCVHNPELRIAPKPGAARPKKMESSAPFRFVTFDCAQTLVDVDWRPAALAVACATDLGLKFDVIAAGEAYDRLLRTRWTEFRELNLERDEKLTDEFWHRLSLDWCEACGLPSARVADLVARAEERLYGPQSEVFRVYPDVVPCLEALRRAGIRLGVISNWDISLHRTLRSLGLTTYFDVVIASLEEGVEKPEAQLFQIALERLGARPEETLHVGDNPIDDLLGAQRVGIRCRLIDRSAPRSEGHVLATLLDLPDSVTA